MITKVQLPMARGSLVLAANQGLLYVLSMAVIGGLVGAGALGYDMVLGFARPRSGARPGRRSRHRPARHHARPHRPQAASVRAPEDVSVATCHTAKPTSNRKENTEMRRTR